MHLPSTGITIYVDLSSFQPNHASVEENEAGQSEGPNDGPSMENPTMVATNTPVDDKPSSTTATTTEPYYIALQARPNTSTVSQAQNDGMFIIRERLRQQGISACSQEIIINSWRSGTKNSIKSTYKNGNYSI